MNFYAMKMFLETRVPDLDEDTVYEILYAFEDNEEELQKMLGGDLYDYTGLGGDGTPEA